MAENLNQRVARAWSRMDEFLELFYAFGVYSPDEIVADGPGYTNSEPMPQSEAFKIGMTYYFRVKMVEIIGDFLLGDKSPFLKEGETRPTMGGSYTQANFTQIMKLFNIMMGQGDFLAANPFSEEAKKMFEKKEMLSKLLEPTKDGDTNPLITQMCHDNIKMSRKVAKHLIKAFSQNANVDKVEKYLKSLQKFMTIDDSLKKHRMEWVFGVAQIVTKKNFGANTSNK